jgi:hypothetical protein
MTGWLGRDKDLYNSLSAAYNDVYKNDDETLNEEVEIVVDEYAVSAEDAEALEEGKKKCKEGYKYDSKKKKCVKKKKSSSSSKKTVVVVKNKGGGYWGGGYHGHGGHGGNGGNGGDGGDGGDGGGDGGDGGDGGGGE